ncbi:MAG: hypothetical protein LUC22_04415, partial [Prevotella sp.]|nr:hypothetical protein [Prevotella sp.]
KIFKLLSLQSLRYCWARTAAACGVNVAITVAVVLVVWGIASSDVMLASSGRMTATAALLLFAGEMLIAAVLLLAFLSPVVYVLTKYIIEPETTMRSAWRAYRTGLRSAGFIVAFVLLCAVVLLIAYVVIALPMMIATGALALSEAGSAAGDAPGLPGSFPVLYALTAFVMCFVWVVLRVWSIFATYYMYASIEAKNGRTDNADGFGGGE